jgi:hypothetical protein
MFEGLSADHGIVMLAVAVEANLNLGVGGIKGCQQHIGQGYAVGRELHGAALSLYMLQQHRETRMYRRLTTTKMDSLHTPQEQPIKAANECANIRMGAVRRSEAKTAAGVAVSGNPKAKGRGKVDWHDEASAIRW